MSVSPDPQTHQKLEQEFLAHAEKLLSDERLRLDTTGGRRPVVTLIRDIDTGDRGVELKRLMSELGKPDRQLEAKMPLGKWLDVVLAKKKWWVLKSPVGRLRVICHSPSRDLLAGNPGSPMTAKEINQLIKEMPAVPAGQPVTLVVVSTSGFTQDAHVVAERSIDRVVILAEPNEAGGWSLVGPTETRAVTELFDPEAEAGKRQRLHSEIDAMRVDLLSGGLSAEKLAARTQLAPQWIEAELKSYARENPGLAARRLQGRIVLFRESSAPAAAAAPGGASMPFIDRMKTLFSRKGDVEKKIAFLSERRAALGQQRDQSYEDLGALETKESTLRDQFKAASGDLGRKRIASQLLQLRKDIERRQQLQSVLNQQINVVSTHLHNLELQQQGKSAQLPDSEEMATDAAAAEEVLAELQANSEMADTVGSSGHGGLSSEEQALYDELMAEQATPAAETPTAAPPSKTPAGEQAPTPAAPAAAPRRRVDPEAG